MMTISCTDNVVDILDENGSSDTNKGLGELVLFTSGRTNNLITTRADGDDNSDYNEIKGETYYMESASRFVCRMYYIADNNSETDFDLTDNTKTISWFKVEGNVGNSLYWSKDYSDASEFDSYHNDKRATFFYWQNRKNHAFLAWTDLNKAKNVNFKYGQNPGDLKLEPADMTYEEHTDRKAIQNVLSGFKIAGVENLFDNIDDTFVAYVKEHYETISQTQTSEIASVASSQAYNPNWINSYYRPVNCVRYSYFEGARHGEVYIPGEPQDEDHLYSFYRGPILLWIWGDGQELEYTLQDGDATDEANPTSDGDCWVKNSHGEIVALRKKVYVEERTDGANPETVYTPDPTEENPDNTKPETRYYIYKYLATFASGKFHYDFSQQPRYCIAIHKYYEVKNIDVVNEYKVNKFDLTRKAVMNSISDQPDPCQALTIMKPMGATQAANRVNLYFKHQFSQVQVNLKASSDNSANITKDHIKKVELLGVSEEGYVFNELITRKNPESNATEYYVHPAAYKDVDISQYDEAQMAVNPHGTSLELFDMGENNVATGYLKSFNAITFGLLKAIRITWWENPDNENTSHVATFKVNDTNLSTLKSGRKYIWNIEIRRGTLAVITTTVDDWIVPTQVLNYETDGIINN